LHYQAIITSHQPDETNSGIAVTWPSYKVTDHKCSTSSAITSTKAQGEINTSKLDSGGSDFGREGALVPGEPNMPQQTATNVIFSQQNVGMSLQMHHLAYHFC